MRWQADCRVSRVVRMESPGRELQAGQGNPSAHAVRRRSESGERFTAEAVGIFLDYSKNRITDETVKLLLQLAEESGLRERIDAMFRGEKINVSEKRAVLHVALRAPKGEVINTDGKDVVPGVHAVLDKMAAFAIASAAASGRATPANAFATSSTSASAAPTSGL